MDETRLKQSSPQSDISSDSGVSNSNTTSSYVIDDGCDTDTPTSNVTNSIRRSRAPQHYRMIPAYTGLASRNNENNIYHEADVHSNKSRSPKGIYVPRIVCCSLVLLLLCLTASTFALMFVLWGKYNHLKNEIENSHVAQMHAQQDPHVCLPCNELLQGPFDEDNVELKNLIHGRENDTEVCCAKSPSQIATLLNLFAKRKQMEKCARDKINENKTHCNNSTGAATPAVSHDVISAHLLAEHQNSSHVNEEQPIKNWLYNKPGYHIQGIQLSDNRLVVPETGLYFLYSQARFLVYYDKGDISTASQSIFHKVFRYHVIYPINGSQELLRSEITQCWEPNKQYGRYTSYIGASVMLQKNDQLYVTVSRNSQLSLESSNFGLYKIK